MKMNLWDRFCSAMLVITVIYLGWHVLHYLIA